ncbi:hypothetical protein [Mesorhizobium sp. 43Arga]
MVDLTAGLMGRRIMDRPTRSQATGLYEELDLLAHSDGPRNLLACC